MGTTTVGTIELITKIDTGDYKRGAKEIDNANKDISSSSDKTSNNLSKAWSVASKAVIAGTTAAAAGVIALSIASIKSTAQLEQSLGGSEVVFGDFSEKIQKLAKESAVVMGTSQRQYLDTANKMASLFQGAGFTVEKSFDLSSAAMQRATDVATAMGISTDMALESIAGAAKGNFTMMDNLGVAMSATSIEAYALAKGITKSYDAMTQAEKIGYAMEMFLEKTAKYAGNYAKENDTLSGSFQTLKGSWENFLSGVEGSDKQGGSSTPQQQLQASGFPSLNIPGGRASGGPVSANTPYFVGENPDGSLNSTSELFVPRSSGKIINSKDLQSSLGSSSSTENNIANVNIYSEVDGERWLRRLTGDSEIVSHGLVPQQQYMGNA